MGTPGAEVAAAVGSKIGDYLIRHYLLTISLFVVCWSHVLGYLVHYKSNIENLMKQVKKLKVKKDGLQRIVDEARNNGDIILADVKRWLDMVDEFCENATNFHEGEVKENNGCLKGWCPNLKACYTLSKKAKKMINEAVELQKRVFNIISCRAPPLPIGVTSIADFRSFESRVHTIKDIVNLLKGDEVSMIGICGMGGVGKTTMVEEIVRRVRDEKLFDKIVMAVVSQNRDSMKIQDEIAYHLGMEFEEKRSLTVRADQLRQRLLQSSKGNLVILDDMWESFDLKEIGIPYGGEYKRCKIVLTSRNEDVCKVMKCGKIFRIKVLSEKEAWSLFREMAGDSVDALDLYLAASNVAKECGGLPISLVTVGKALNGKSKEEWYVALAQLRKSIVPATLSEVEPKVYRSLQLSYDHLGGKEAKSLFLLCCFYPEDTNISLEDLVRYGVGLRLFEDIDSLTQARDRVLALTRELKSCFLLLDGSKRFYVRLHDDVRDFGIMIARASKENQFNMKMILDGGWPMVTDDAYKDCNALSVVSNTIRDLPSEGFDCPNLRVLRLACRNLSPDAPNSRNVFGGMPNLRVLDMQGMHVPSLSSTFELLKNLRALSLEGCKWLEDKCELHEKLMNLEILSINNNTIIRELPEDIGRLTNLRLLDMRGCSIWKIPPSVFSCLRLLEDLHTGGWRPAEEGDKSDNASFGQLESLSNLTSLATWVPHARLLQKSHFLKKLKRYAMVVGESKYLRRKKYLSQNCFLEKSLSLEANCIDDAPLGGGIDHLLKQGTETLHLTGDGLKIVLDQLFPEGSIHLRKLYINACNGRVEYLVDTGTAELVQPIIKVFAKLEKLILNNMRHLKEICHGQQLPAGSFGCLQKMDLINLPALTHLWEYRNQSVTLGNLRFVRVKKCNRLENLPRSLMNLESLEIDRCLSMKEVISNQGPSGTTITDGVELENIHIIEFPNLIRISLWELRSLTCFSKGMDQINLPQLTDLEIERLPKLTSFCPEENRNVGLQSLFNHKVKLTNLKNLILKGLYDMTEIWSDQLDGDSFHELKKVAVNKCDRISTVLRCNMTQVFQNLEELRVEHCSLVKGVFEYGEEGSVAVVLLPRLKELKLSYLPKLTQIWKKHIRMNHGFRELSFIRIELCDSMKHVFSTSVAKALVKLQELCVELCKMMEQIVAKDLLEGDTSELSGMMKFQNLRTLSLHNLDELKSFSSSSFMNAEINSQPLFGNQVTFPILEELKLGGLPNFKELWCSQIPTGSFQKVRVLKVWKCHKLVNIIPSHLLKVFSSLEELEVCKCNSMEELFDSKGVSIEERYHATLIERTLKRMKVEECGHIRNLFPSSIARGLVHLQQLEVKSCPMIEEVFMEKADEDGRKDKTLFPALEILKLRELPRLKSFCNVNYTIELPALKNVRIFDCSEMTTFSSSFVRTPKLDGVRFNPREEEIIRTGNLNKTIEHLFEEKENTGSGSSILLEFDQMTGDLREDGECVECTNEVSFNLALGSSDNLNMSSSSSLSSVVFRGFSLNEIKDATNNFHMSNFLGKGGEGRVYLGHVATGQDKKFLVAVKQLKPDSIGFENEIKMVSKIQHPNLVSLLGYCNEFDHKILIYEYMQRGSLSDYVNKKNKKSSICLSWKQRLKICLGAARGLQYLHTATDESPKGIIHRDMKPANILLDNNWVAKVSDFGMFKLSHTGQTKSIMSTSPKGTAGYFAPEYLKHSRITRRIDVYAFGVVLFEVLCRKMPWDRGDESYYRKDDEDLGLWAHENVDIEIIEEISGDSLKIFADIIGRSLRPIPGDRPTMDEVVRDLVRCQELEHHQGNRRKAPGKHKIKRLNRPETQEQESEKETQEQESEHETQEQESEDGSNEHSDD